MVCRDVRKAAVGDCPDHLLQVLGVPRSGWWRELPESAALDNLILTQSQVLRTRFRADVRAFSPKALYTFEGGMTAHVRSYDVSPSRLRHHANHFDRQGLSRLVAPQRDDCAVIATRRAQFALGGSRESLVFAMYEGRRAHCT